jgi:hypothetical protein
MTHSAETVTRAIDLFETGRSRKSIAKELEISTHAVRNWLSADREALVTARTGAGDHDRTTCPLISSIPRPEYAYLLGQYLGDGSIARHPRDVYRLVISTCDQYPRIRAQAEVAMAAVIGRKVGAVQSAGCTNINAYSKHWPCLFPQHGPGMKHERLIALKDWQWDIVRLHTRDFVAGLIHSDGCRCINRVVTRGKRYEYPRYFFSNQSMDILQICGDALDMLGVEWRFNRKNSISVAKRASVAILDEFIGPKT